MADALNTFVFRDPAFAPSGDTLVCVVDAEESAAFISQSEIANAFSGYVLYQRETLEALVGVWGRRNCARFRRFLEERGADLLVMRERPEGFRIAHYGTRNERKRVRKLYPLRANDC